MSFGLEPAGSAFEAEETPKIAGATALTLAVGLFLGVAVGAVGMWEAHPFVASLMRPADLVHGEFIDTGSIPLREPTQARRTIASPFDIARSDQPRPKFSTRCDEP